MIDLKAARANPAGVRTALARKGAADAFDCLLEADERWRALVPRVDELRAKTKLKGKPTPEQLEELQAVKAELKSAEDELAAAEDERDALALRVPNPPDDDVPDGSNDADAREVRRVGEPPSLSDPRDHLELGRFEMERAARMSGSRFGYWVGDTARLALALYRLALERLADKGFVTVLPPVLVREEALVGTGAFPSDEANVYELPEDDLYLAGTAEIPVASIHAGEILPADDLPLRYVAFSPCFRREAGAAGRDTRGMIRVHQFNKVEQFVLTRPEESWDELELLLANTEELVREVGLPYRVVVLPAGDMSSASAKTYDVEVWFPSQERYRETASISNTTDFQARRLQIRFRGEHGPEPVHMLNGTAVVDRMALAILENFQGEVPDALRAYGAPDRVTR
ncbi:serine--tRNA ligase [Gaiella sp.]|uniref:serine--tRNA ligase n=1 Tax=Gaiella sp. TaxID=2663207 RepID=UPI002C5B845B|nr:serine--tRNA ligase [Gaiella sp.]HWO81864.1 serine--tRNA ligase [Gaiella sp.]